MTRSGRRRVTGSAVVLLALAASLALAANTGPPPVLQQGPQIAPPPGRIIVAALRTGNSLIQIGNITKLHDLKITGPGNTVLGPLSLQIGQRHVFSPVPPGSYTAAATKYYFVNCPSMSFTVGVQQTVTLIYYVNKPPLPPTCTVKKTP